MSLNSDINISHYKVTSKKNPQYLIFPVYFAIFVVKFIWNKEENGNMQKWILKNL